MFTTLINQSVRVIEFFLFLDILDNSAGEFEDTEEVYEAVGEVLQGISEKSEDDIRFVKLLFIIIISAFMDPQTTWYFALILTLWNTFCAYHMSWFLSCIDCIWSGICTSLAFHSTTAPLLEKQFMNSWLYPKDNINNSDTGCYCSKKFPSHYLN